MKKHILSVLICLFFSVIGFAAINYPNPIGFVNDYAGILSAQEKQELEANSRALKDKTGAELAFAIVRSVAPLDSKTYAVELFEKWKIGQKGKDNGVLVLLAMDEKRIEIEVGYGLEGALPDAYAGQILDTYAVPSFKQGKFGQGLVEVSKALSAKIQGEEVAINEPNKKIKAQDLDGSIIWVIIGVIVLGIIGRRTGSIMFGIFGAFWGAAYGGLIGAIAGALFGLFFGVWGWTMFGSGGGFGGGSFGGGGGGFGGFGGGGSGGGGSGRSW